MSDLMGMQLANFNTVKCIRRPGVIWKQGTANANLQINSCKELM